MFEKKVKYASIQATDVNIYLIKISMFDGARYTLFKNCLERKINMD